MSRNRQSLSSARASRPAGVGPSAFTLVELIAVVLILGIAAAIVVPMVSNTGDIDTAAAARRLTSDLLFAQNYAITHQTRVRVAFNLANNQYTLAEIPADGNPVVLTHPVTRQPYVVAFNAASGLAGVDLDSAEFLDQTSVEFDSMGAPSQGGTVTLASGGVARTITVAPITGKVTVN